MAGHIVLAEGPEIALSDTARVSIEAGVLKVIDGGMVTYYSPSAWVSYETPAVAHIPASPRSI